MKSVYIVIEGQSEEKFVKEMLTPYFAQKGIFLYPEVVITGKNTKGKLCKGGGDSYQLYKNHLQRLIKQFAKAENYYFSTMIDLYALPVDFPCFDESQKYSDKYQLVHFLEECFKRDMGANNFIPYIQLHEFESLLLHDIQKISDVFFDTPVDTKKLQEEISKYDNFELVNSSSAPSKRIDKYTDGQYCGRKVTTSFEILKNVDVDFLRSKYLHFHEWLTKIENIS